MGVKVAQYILRFRIIILLVMSVFVLFFAYYASSIELDYETPKILPRNHQATVAYKEFKELFGADGFNILIGIKDKDFYTLEKFNKWKELGIEFSKIKGIDSAFSEANFYTLSKKDSTDSFQVTQILNEEITTQSQLDSLRIAIRKLPFYNGTLFNDNTHFHAMMLMVNPNFFYSKKRGKFVTDIRELGAKYDKYFDGEMYFTGLPFIKASNMLKVQSELSKFMALSLIATILVLFFFFRSVNVIVVSSIIVVIGVVLTLGLIGIFGYKITVVMGLLPPLIIVIGIPNCVYLINKYQQLFLDSGNKELALTNVITKIGHITLLTNLTTAFGFGTFIFTNSQLLFEFGLIAFFSIILLFLVTVLLVPVFLSFLPEPKERQTKHLQKNWVGKLLINLRYIVRHKKKYIFGITISLVFLSVFGISLLSTSGKMVDDLPNGDKVKTDMVAVQENLSGVMPFEIILDLKRKNNRLKRSVLLKMDSVQEYLESYSEITKSTSLVNALKFLNQTLIFDGAKEDYEIPSSKYLRQIASKLEKDTIKDIGFSLDMFLDSSGTKTRITSQMKDVGIDKLEIIIDEVAPVIDEILNPDKKEIMRLFFGIENGTEEEKVAKLDSLISEFPAIEYAYLSILKEEGDENYERYQENGLDYSEIVKDKSSRLEKGIQKTFIDSKLTGFTVPFAKGTKYLIKNLILSLLIAVFGISLLMYLLFKSFWIVIISLVTNVIPLLFTAGIMGFFGVDLKPSTVLVFSISLGIAVDDAIHFLAKFKQELKASDKNINKAVYAALRETGVSMFYTSVILFFGFSVFIASSYGGTQALGILISITLLVAMLSNLLLLPALLLISKTRIER